MVETCLARSPEELMSRYRRGMEPAQGATPSTALPAFQRTAPAAAAAAGGARSAAAGTAGSGRPPRWVTPVMMALQPAAATTPRSVPAARRVTPLKMAPLPSPAQHSRPRQAAPEGSELAETRQAAFGEAAEGEEDPWAMYLDAKRALAEDILQVSSMSGF